MDSYVYDGKAKKPSVKVYDEVGLIASNRYTVSYTNNKNVGKATITVKLKSPYSGTVKGSFKIIPKTTTISKVTSPKTKQIKVTWKKQTTQTSGYRIMYSTDKNFSSYKIIKVAGKTKTSYTIKSLKKGKTYYVKVGTYWTKGSVSCYSKWSAKKSIKTK